VHCLAVTPSGSRFLTSKFDLAAHSEPNKNFITSFFYYDTIILLFDLHLAKVDLVSAKLKNL
jgi:hypothetical protein